MVYNSGTGMYAASYIPTVIGYDLVTVFVDGVEVFRSPYRSRVIYPDRLVNSAPVLSGALALCIRNEAAAKGLTLASQLGGLVCINSVVGRSEEHTSELQSRLHLVCRLLLEKKK